MDATLRVNSYVKGHLMKYVLQRLDSHFSLAKKKQAFLKCLGSLVCTLTKNIPVQSDSCKCLSSAQMLDLLAVQVLEFEHLAGLSTKRRSQMNKRIPCMYQEKSFQGDICIGSSVSAVLVVVSLGDTWSFNCDCIAYVSNRSCQVHTPQLKSFIDAVLNLQHEMCWLPLMIATRTQIPRESYHLRKLLNFRNKFWRTSFLIVPVDLFIPSSIVLKVLGIEECLLYHIDWFVEFEKLSF
ncbi:hypothetical protein Tco_0340945 [Tanacetum coccineum]